MIRNGEFYMIHEMKKRGMSISQIANELGRDRKTIRKWLQQSEPAYYQRHVKRPSKLDPFKDYIRRRMEEGCLNANVIFDEIKAQGYTGRKTILRSFMQPLRPSVLSKATVRFETSIQWWSFFVRHVVSTSARTSGFVLPFRSLQSEQLAQNVSYSYHVHGP